MYLICLYALNGEINLFILNELISQVFESKEQKK